MKFHLKSLSFFFLQDTHVYKFDPAILDRDSGGGEPDVDSAVKKRVSVFEC